jgi:Ca2+-binding EF-hand superfamily protein
MLTDLQRKKITRIFRLYDVDGDGFVGREDYERVAHNVADHNGYAKGSPQYDGVLTSYLNAWEGTRRMSDRDNDNRISLDEHLAGYEHLLDTAGPAAFVAVADAATALIDQDGDGKLSQHEWVNNLVAWASGAISESVALETFRKLDTNGDGYIGRDEMRTIVREFFTSDDPNALGNWMVGPYE